MSLTLRPIPVGRMLEHIVREMEMSSTVFSVTPGYRGAGRGPEVPGGWTELPLGPAAGPHTQMAQSLVAAYVAGARCFELATVTPEPLGVGEPYIQVDWDGCHRPRGSILTPAEMTEEFIKGWFVIKLLSRELGLGDSEGFSFNMTAAGSREALSAPEFSAFFDAMGDASALPLWEECRAAALAQLRRFNNLDRDYVQSVSPRISRWVTLVARPGDSLAQLTETAKWLLDRGLHTYLKLNPSLLGADALRELLKGDGLWRPGDFTLTELTPALAELQAKGEENGLTFGVTVSGGTPLTGGSWLTGPHTGEAGAALAAALREALPDLPLAYAGGADAMTVGPLSGAGFSPIYAATTLLKPGGYLRLRQMARAMAEPGSVDLKAVGRAFAAYNEGRERRPHRRLPGKSPMLDCFTAPCQGGCPFHADVTGFLRLVSDGRCRDALRVMVDRNPLPHVTAALCDRPCADYCVRCFYDTAVDVAADLRGCLEQEGVWPELLARLEPEPYRVGQRVAVVGGGPAGMSAAYLFAKRGVAVTLFEQSDRLGGSLNDHPASAAQVALDAQLLEAMGADVRLGTAAPAAPEVFKLGYSHVVLAIGAADAALLAENGITADLTGAPALSETLENKGGGVYLIGAARNPNLGIAQTIADAHTVADGILGPAAPYPHTAGRRGGAMGKKGKLIAEPPRPLNECERCLGCSTVCETCVDVCPRRANVPITVLTRRKPWILHLDALCDHCGNCASFCPYDSAPHREKFTLYETLEDFTAGKNSGFVMLDFLSRKVRVRLGEETTDASLRHAETGLPGDVQELMETVFIDYPYLLDPDRRKDDGQMSLLP